MSYITIDMEAETAKAKKAVMEILEAEFPRGVLPTPRVSPKAIRVAQTLALLNTALIATITIAVLTK